MNPTLTQGQNYIDPGGRTGVVNFNTATGQRLGAGQTTYSNPGLGQLSNTQPVGALNSSVPLVAPQYAPPTNFLNEITNNTQSDINTNQQDYERRQASTDSVSNSYMSFANQLLGQTGDRIGAENSAGLPGLNTTARDLQTLSQRQLAAYAQNIQNNDINATGQTRSSQNGNEAFISRQHGIDAMITNANISAVNGQIATAQAQVDRAMSLKYDPIKQAMQNQLDFINLNKDSLNRADKKLADAKATKLQLDMKQVDKQQQDETDKQAMLIDASAQQAPSSVLKNAQDIIAKDGTPVQVALALGKYTGAAAKAEMLREQIKTEKAQQSKIYSDIARTKSDTAVLSIDDAAKLGVPYGTTKAQAILLQGNGQTKPLDEAEKNTLSSAQRLSSSFSNDFKGLFGKGNTAPVGLNGILGTIPGTKSRDFSVGFDNLKSNLALAKVKLLKGPLSDKDVVFISNIDELSRSQSPAAFKKSLDLIINNLETRTPEYQYVSKTSGMLKAGETALTPSASSYANSLIKP